jgi:hypothetical protein
VSDRTSGEGGDQEVKVASDAGIGDFGVQIEDLLLDWLISIFNLNLQSSIYSLKSSIS